MHFKTLREVDFGVATLKIRPLQLHLHHHRIDKSNGGSYSPEKPKQPYNIPTFNLE